MIYLDTHVAAWLYAGNTALLSDPAADAIRHADELRISPMVQLELQYLYEIRRVSEPPAPVLDTLRGLIGLTECRADFPAIVRVAEQFSWTRDPFDRLIVAQANLNDAVLVTRDKSIREHYPRAIW